MSKYSEKFVKELLSTVIKIVSEIPEIAKHINIPLTIWNFPDIILDDYIRLHKKDYEKLKKLGYYIDVGCVAACGYGYVDSKEDGDYIEFYTVDCYCHPGHYFLVLRPR